MALVYLLCLLVLLLYFWRNPARLGRDDGMPEGEGWTAGRDCDWVPDFGQAEGRARRRWVCRKCKQKTVLNGQALPDLCMKEREAR